MSIFSIGPCVGTLVECPGCAEARARGEPCDWCCGSHRVPQKVAEVIQNLQNYAEEYTGPSLTDEQRAFFRGPSQGEYHLTPSYHRDLLLGEDRWHLYWDGTGVIIQKCLPRGSSTLYGWPHEEAWDLPPIVIKTAEQIAAQAMNSIDRLTPTLEPSGPSRWKYIDE